MSKPIRKKDSMKMSEITRSLLDQLEPEDIEDGCYDGISVVAMDENGQAYQIAGVSTTILGVTIHIKKAGLDFTEPPAD